MNWGLIFAWTQIGLSLLASLGFFIAGDARRGFYYLFAAGIGVCVIV